jgi:hypothetical protein
VTAVAADDDRELLWRELERTAEGFPPEEQLEILWWHSRVGGPSVVGDVISRAARLVDQAPLWAWWITPAATPSNPKCLAGSGEPGA